MGEDISGIDQRPIYTKVAGVSFDDRQEAVKSLLSNTVLLLVREPENQFDTNAIKVLHGDKQLGYLKRELAKELAPMIDSGSRFSCLVKQVTGGSGKESFGLNVVITKL
jgi:hypothetical protein